MIKGSIVALVTPFLKNGKVNYVKLKELLQFHLDNSSDGILLFGTTGEGSTLSLKEKVKIAKKSLKYVNHRIPIILNAGSNSTSEAIRIAKKFSKLNPYALLVITPYYNKANEEGMYNHFKKIQDNSSVPIILYNVPSRTTIDISISLIKRLSKLDKVIGIKEASRDEEKLMELSKLQNDEFYWYSGNDERMIKDIKLGAKGLIGVITNSHPKIINNIVQSSLEGKYVEAQKQYSNVEQYIDLLNLDVNPIIIKECMNFLNFDVGGYRLPLYQTSNLNKLKIKKVIKEKSL